MFGSLIIWLDRTEQEIVRIKTNVVNLIIDDICSQFTTIEINENCKQILKNGKKCKKKKKKDSDFCFVHIQNKIENPKLNEFNNFPYNSYPQIPYPQIPDNSYPQIPYPQIPYPPIPDNSYPQIQLHKLPFEIKKQTNNLYPQIPNITYPQTIPYSPIIPNNLESMNPMLNSDYRILNHCDLM